jgi:hypothetical protein
LVTLILLLYPNQGPIWPLLPAQIAETLQASRLSVAQTNDKVKATVLTPAQPVGSLISATRMTAASVKATHFHRVAIGDNGGGKCQCSEFLTIKDKLKVCCI